MRTAHTSHTLERSNWNSGFETTEIIRIEFEQNFGDEKKMPKISILNESLIESIEFEPMFAIE